MSGKKYIILRDGWENGVFYNRGEIYELSDIISRKVVKLKNNKNEEFVVTVVHTEKYGSPEAEIYKLKELNVWI